ncbi:MAG: hypothetical protein RL367_1072, partial [Pseudomonadota bacterium]
MATRLDHQGCATFFFVWACMVDWPDHLGADRYSAPGGQPVVLVDAASF